MAGDAYNERTTLGLIRPGGRACVTRGFCLSVYAQELLADGSRDLVGVPLSEAGHSSENARASLQVQQLEVILKEHRFSAWWLAGGLPAILWRRESQVLR